MQKLTRQRFSANSYARSNNESQRRRNLKLLKKLFKPKKCWKTDNRPEVCDKLLKNLLVIDCARDLFISEKSVPGMKETKEVFPSALL